MDIKLDILESVIGSKTAATNFKESINTARFKTGTIIVANNKTSPAAPTAFFISTLLATIKFNPSDKYDPTRGIELKIYHQHYQQ